MTIVTILGNIIDEKNLNDSIREYVSNLNEDDRKSLKDELYYNINFNNDFKLKLARVGMIFACLTNNNIEDEVVKEVLNGISNEMIGEPLEKNQHILSMYEFYINNLSELLINELSFSEENAQLIIQEMSNVLKTPILFHQLNEGLQKNKIDKETDKIKI